MSHLDLVLDGSFWEAGGVQVHDGSGEGDREVGVSRDTQLSLATMCDGGVSGARWTMCLWGSAGLLSHTCWQSKECGVGMWGTARQCGRRNDVP